MCVLLVFCFGGVLVVQRPRLQRYACATKLHVEQPICSGSTCHCQVGLHYQLFTVSIRRRIAVGAKLNGGNVCKEPCEIGLNPRSHLRDFQSPF